MQILKCVTISSKRDPVSKIMENAQHHPLVSKYVYKHIHTYTTHILNTHKKKFSINTNCLPLRHQKISLELWHPQNPRLTSAIPALAIARPWQPR